MNRNELIEAAARESWKVVNPRSPWADTSLRKDYMDATAAELPVIIEAVLARIEALHHPVEVEPSDTICGPCSFQLPNGRFFGKVVEWPCPDMAEASAIRAEWGQS